LVHQVRSVAEILNDQHFLGLLQVRIDVGECVVVIPFDHEHAGHAVEHIDRGRSVLVRVVPMGSRALPHCITGWLALCIDNVLGELEAEGIYLDLVLRPLPALDQLVGLGPKPILGWQRRIAGGAAPPLPDRRKERCIPVRVLPRLTA
jgi:hypothetical protein